MSDSYDDPRQERLMQAELAVYSAKDTYDADPNDETYTALHDARVEMQAATAELRAGRPMGITSDSVE